MRGSNSHTWRAAGRRGPRWSAEKPNQFRGRADISEAPIGAVPRWAYLDAILDDRRWILDGRIIESPFYGVLNICRCAHVLLGNPAAPPSKDESGQWALDHLPDEHRPVVVAALECYHSEASVPVDEHRQHGHSWDEQPLLDIASWARTSILTES